MPKFRNLMPEQDPVDVPASDPKTGRKASGRAGDGSGNAPDKDSKAQRAEEPDASNEPVGEADKVTAGLLASTDDWLQELARPCDETVVRTDSSAPYIGFASPRSQSWEPLRQLFPKITEATPFVGMPGGDFELADPLIFYVVRFRQFWSQRSEDDNYTIQTVEFSDPGRHSDLREEFLAACIVQLNQRLVPTVSFFGGTKAGALRQAADTLCQAGSPDWAKRSKAHAATASFPLPFGRFLTQVTIEPKISKEKGRSYQLAVGHVRPATLEELALLTEMMRDVEFRRQFKAALEVYALRLKVLEEIAGGDLG
jgi:hypothetical protein